MIWHWVKPLAGSGQIWPILACVSVTSASESLCPCGGRTVVSRSSNVIGWATKEASGTGSGVFDVPVNAVRADLGFILREYSNPATLYSCDAQTEAADRLRLSGEGKKSCPHTNPREWNEQAPRNSTPNLLIVTGGPPATRPCTYTREVWHIGRRSPSADEVQDSGVLSSTEKTVTFVDVVRICAPGPGCIAGTFLRKTLTFSLEGERRGKKGSVPYPTGPARRSRRAKAPGSSTKGWSPNFLKSSLKKPLVEVVWGLKKPLSDKGSHVKFKCSPK
ncbi:hypothetical protein DFH07DRAFT_770643 [Mycena maculata]|uniref:Uncharacterized protein n=1 Tax=Mycena maculata TaxID=230809 RepID=A0AAD7JFP9_9AGAR|nr:hypothetical protein DFH07DRAFT_770643 [Mycena maculata]